MAAPRYFIHQYPTKARFEHSPYYWWWEYMRRVPDYGPRHRLYTDFGELGEEFWPWWREHGADLFAEQLVTRTCIVSSEVKEIPEDSILVLVPALHPSMTADELVKQFRKVVRAPRKRGGSSTAKYPIWGKPEWRPLQTTLAFYDLRVNKPELTLYEIGERVHGTKGITFTSSDIISTDDPKDVTSAKRFTMKVTVSRYIRHAKGYIKNAGLGVFPKKT